MYYQLIELVEVNFTYDYEEYRLHSVCWLLVTANVVPSTPILVTLMMEVLHFSETSVFTRATWCNISRRWAFSNKKKLLWTLFKLNVT
jgi:hypothetical protein